MARGRAKRVRIDGLDELAALIEGLTSQQAIALGALRDDLPDEVRIVTKAALADGVAANDAVARTAKQLRLPAGTARAGAVRLRHQGHAARGDAAARRRRRLLGGAGVRDSLRSARPATCCGCRPAPG